MSSGKCRPFCLSLNVLKYITVPHKAFMRPLSLECVTLLLFMIAFNLEVRDCESHFEKLLYQWKYIQPLISWETMTKANFVISTVPANGLVLSDIQASTDTVVTSLGYRMYTYSWRVNFAYRIIVWNNLC